jgi:hypothetical protein
MKSIYKSLGLVALILTLTALSDLQAANAVKTFTVYNKTVTFTLPDEWQSVTKEMGVPVKLLGPKFQDQRPVIVVSPIDMKNEVITLDNPEEALASYKKSRLVWLQKFNGSALDFAPIKVFKAGNHNVHQFGLTYAFNSENYSEKSLYVECENKIFHIKTLAKLEHVKKWEDEVTKIINSFQCK